MGHGEDLYKRHTQPEADVLALEDEHSDCEPYGSGVHKPHTPKVNDPYRGLESCGNANPLYEKIDNENRERSTVIPGAPSDPYFDNGREYHFEYTAPRSAADIVRDIERERLGLPSFAEGGVIKQRRAYVSGPMRGKPNLNHAVFDSAERELEANGWRVHNPAAKDREEGWDNDTSYATAIRADVIMLLDSDAIFLLPGWQASEGARFEAEIARSLGLDFYVMTNVGDEPGTPGNIPIWEWAPFEPKNIGVEGIDQEARRLVYGDRAATYGHPRGDFDTIALMWSGILRKKLEQANADFITGEEVALMMAALKLARLASTPTHHDSQVDTIGYMLCLARLQEDPTEIAAWDERAEAARNGSS